MAAVSARERLCSVRLCYGCCYCCCLSQERINVSAVLWLLQPSSSPVFLMMYSAYKLNKKGDYIQPRHTPFPIWNQSVIPCPLLMLLLDLHTDFSGGSSSGLVFPSLDKFSTVCCDPHSQRLGHSQESRNRCFSGTLAFLFYNPKGNQP